MDAYPTQYRKMDFSLGELLEKFEKHFGILATRILLGIFSLAAVSYCLHIIYHYFCIPIYLIIQWIITDSAIQPLKIEDVASGVLSSLLSFFLYWILVTVGLRYFSPKWNQFKKELDESDKTIKRAITYLTHRE